jgi:two-component system chemotaxis response regulator CheY
MNSSKQYLDSPPKFPREDSAQAESDVLAVTIQAYRSALREMGNCSAEALPVLGLELRKSLWRLEESLSGEIDIGMIATTKSVFSEQMQPWGKRAAEQFREANDAVMELLKVLVRTAESFGDRDLQCAGQLAGVLECLEGIASLDDLTKVRLSIEKSAADLKASVTRMTAAGKAAISQLREEVAAYQVKLEEAEDTASRDALTGLRNRAWVEDQISRRIKSGSQFCVAIADIDGFKKVNDDHGHLAGDELLQQFAAELQSTNRSSDAIGRWGGDEFIVVLNASLSTAPAQIDRLSLSVCKRYQIQSRTGPLTLSVSASFGMAEHIRGEAILELLARADSAMYQHKGVVLTPRNQEPPAIQETSLEPNLNAKRGSNRMKSLVAEDDATNRRLLQTFLSKYGGCDIAVDGKEAVSAVRRARENHQSYDLVCMDLRMPEMDGQEAIREIRKQEAIAGVVNVAKIIVTTIHTDMDSITGALLGRCNAYLVKPIDTAKLRNELTSLGLIK